ncbi:F-box-like [Popillia japonica]|uniref:F-box-like n=1 Tax=Popillia japonica TaxID=7064 RepID=A0AAW1NEX1_POPJA
MNTLVLYCVLNMRQSNLENRNSTPADYNPENGLSLKGYHIPEEILGEIFRKLPPSERLRARLVYTPYT